MEKLNVWTILNNTQMLHSRGEDPKNWREDKRVVL